MPGNTIKINDSSELEWYLGDSKMPNLVKYLNKNGIKEIKGRDKSLATQTKNWTSEELDRVLPQFNPHNYRDYIENIITDHDRNDTEKVEELSKLAKELVDKSNQAITECKQALLGR